MKLIIKIVTIIVTTSAAAEIEAGGYTDQNEQQRRELASMSYSMDDCHDCVMTGNRNWCPAKDSVSKGNCLSVTPNKDLYNLDYCSDRVNGMSAKIQKSIKMFSCPFENYCGTLDLETIIPFYTGGIRDFTRYEGVNGLKHFSAGHVCRYRIKFPMDAGANDNINFVIKYLRNIKVTIGLGYDYSKNSLNGQTFLFTESVNMSAGGGYVKFPHPYEGFMVIEYDPTTIPDDPNIENGEYKFTLQFLKSEYSDRINEAFGDQTIGAKVKPDGNAKLKIEYNNTETQIIEREDHKDLDTVILIVAVGTVLLVCFIIIIVCFIVNQMKYNQKISEVVKMDGMVEMNSSNINMKQKRRVGPSSKPVFDDSNIDDMDMQVAYHQFEQSKRNNSNDLNQDDPTIDVSDKFNTYNQSPNNGTEHPWNQPQDIQDGSFFRNQNNNMLSAQESSSNFIAPVVQKPLGAKYAKLNFETNKRVGPVSGVGAGYKS